MSAARTDNNWHLTKGWNLGTLLSIIVALAGFAAFLFNVQAQTQLNAQAMSQERDRWNESREWMMQQMELQAETQRLQSEDIKARLDRIEANLDYLRNRHSNDG